MSFCLRSSPTIGIGSGMAGAGGSGTTAASAGAGRGGDDDVLPPDLGLGGAEDEALGGFELCLGGVEPGRGGREDIRCVVGASSMPAGMPVGGVQPVRAMALASA